jgi:hypothetical protein
MGDLRRHWRNLDAEIAQTPLPPDLRHKWVRVTCADCNASSDARFHFVGLKCGPCGSYNTSQTGQPLEDHSAENARLDTEIEMLLANGVPGDDEDEEDEGGEEEEEEGEEDEEDDGLGEEE